MKTTRSDTKNQSTNITLAIVMLIISAVMICSAFSVPHIFAATGAPSAILIFFSIAYFATAFIFAIIPIALIISTIRAYYNIHREQKVIQESNPYQYYKELPNNFGIGIASLLCDSTIENEKDIVAALLDLCAQGYLHLSKHSDHYVIQIEPIQPKTPLENEAYLINLIRENQIHNISYQKWYNLCVQDGVALGLYKPTRLSPPSSLSSSKVNHSLPKTKNFNKIIIPCIIIGVIALILAITLSDFAPNQHIFLSITVSIFIIVGILIPTIIAFIKSFTKVGGLAKKFSRKTYKSILETRLTKTPKGIDELHKLYSFKNFLAKFNTFIDKNPEAVILWDRYLSYAQVFGLTKEIMKSGYHELINNTAFHIDNINNITLNNISITS